MGGGNFDGKNNTQIVYDTNVQIQYSGIWSLNATDIYEGRNKITLTSHSTAFAGSSAFLSFNGSGVQVIGEIPPGQSNLSAKYIIDEGEPQYTTQPTIAQNTSFTNQVLFVSPALSFGIHNISINVTQTGGDRNYTLWSFDVLTKDTEAANAMNKNKNVGAIVGAVLGAVVFLLLLLLAACYIWRRRRRSRTFHDGRVPPKAYDVQPMGNGSPTEEKLYMYKSVSSLNTDSKLAFAAQRETRRMSWVSVDMPPSIPRSVVVNDRPVSDWSSYHGSSMIEDKSRPHVEQSHFSPYTVATFSPMAFRQPLPAPRNPLTVPPVEFNDLPTTSRASGSVKGRAM
ncbi:hypothetical protein DFH11DRAFT_1689313 [Phellopilus nigrolimitatus]|nr:hypothetical protein DFH11DRAFT_1689313 [Phellopilus nigrolimitatus]